MSTLNKGDEVIIPAPYWVSYPDITILAEGKPIIVECKKQNSFKITPEQLEENITSKTKWFMLNSPSNPTGSTYSYDELKELSKVLLKHENVITLTDDNIRLSKRALDKDTLDWFYENNKKLGDVITTRIHEVLKTGVI